MDSTQLNETLTAETVTTESGLSVDRSRWDMLQCSDLPAPADSWAAETLRSFAIDTLPAVRSLPREALDGDIGDVVPSPRIVGIGVTIADAMLGRLDPVAAAASVVRDAHGIAPLRPDELAVLDPVVRARFAMSMAIAELHIAEHPENTAQLSPSQETIALLVDVLRTIPAAEMHATYRRACDLVPIAAQHDVGEFFESPDFDPAPIVDVDLTDAQIIDWSAGADRRQHIPDDRPALGRYAELRTIYDTPAFGTPFGERRTLHLGIDVFVPAGTPAQSPLDGVVHSCDIRDEPGDYGGVVLIEYETDGGVPFWMLVGHLDHTSINTLRPGDRIARGATFALVGSREENGGWAPHLHVQLFTDLLGRSTELDGVARASQRDVWMSISPNPAPLVVGVDRRVVEAVWEGG